MRTRVHLVMSLVAIGVIALVALVAAACNDKEADATPPPAQASATEATQPTNGDEDEGEEAEDGEEEAFEVERGCPACHHLVEPDTGKYTLGYEAHERAEARGKEHPDVAPDGTAMGPTDEPSVTVCLTCHAAGTGERAGMGRVAALSLRDIVHPAHLFSETFVGRYRGNCMSCHNVSGDGVWQILSEEVTVNEKGVPSPDELPLPGALNPSDKQ